MVTLCTNVPHVWGTFVQEVGQVRTEVGHLQERHNKL